MAKINECENFKKENDDKYKYIYFINNIHLFLNNVMFFQYIVHVGIYFAIKFN